MSDTEILLNDPLCLCFQQMKTLSWKVWSDIWAVFLFLLLFLSECQWRRYVTFINNEHNKYIWGTSRKFITLEDLCTDNYTNNNILGKAGKFHHCSPCCSRIQEWMQGWGRGMEIKPLYLMKISFSRMQDWQQGPVLDILNQSPEEFHFPPMTRENTSHPPWVEASFSVNIYQDNYIDDSPTEQSLVSTLLLNLVLQYLNSF